MSFGYQLQEQAQKDYNESVIWYFERSPQAAIEFVEAIDFTLQQICSYPIR